VSRAVRERIATTVAIVAALATGAAPSILVFALAFSVLLAALGVLIWPLAKMEPVKRHHPRPRRPADIDPAQTRLDQLYADQLLLRRFQLFPVEWLTLADAQKWMGVTEQEAERALASLRRAGKVVAEGNDNRWTLTTEARREAIDIPVVALPTTPVVSGEGLWAPEPKSPGLLFVLDADQARIVQEFIEGTRRAAANPEERELLRRLRVFAEDQG
jgi:hypothetical protein